MKHEKNRGTWVSTNAFTKYVKLITFVSLRIA